MTISSAARLLLLFSCFVSASAQADTVAPAPVKMISAKQGFNVGDIVVSWEPNTEPDVVQYRVYLATDIHFGSPTFNRLTFPSGSAGQAPVGTHQFTLSGVATNANNYVVVTALDNSNPTNESLPGPALGVNLRPDGTPPSERIVLDLDRNVPGQSAFTSEGYFHSIVYTGQALTALSRNYDSATATAVESGAVTLIPATTGVVIWSNLLDGTGQSSVALTTASVIALTTFCAADGNLLMSGAALTEDLAFRGPAALQFMTDVLKASLQSGNAASSEITGDSAFAAMGIVRVNLTGPTALVANSSIANDVLSPLPGAVGLCSYTGIATTTGYPAVVNAGKTVLLGFEFESVGKPTGGLTATRLAREDLMRDAVRYLTNPLATVATWELY